MSIVGKKAPYFSTPAVIGGKHVEQSFSLKPYLGKKEVLLFFYPKAFTSLCYSEMLAFQEKIDVFEKAGVALLGISTDTEDTHLAWLKTPQEQGGIEGVTYPLLSDASKTISYNYGVLGGDWEEDEEGGLRFVDGPPMAYRATFLIDKAGVVRHQLVNDFMIGRHVDEALRIVHALQHHEQNQKGCPANWSPGSN